MRNGDEIWRQRLWVWLPALAFFLINAAAFSVYRLGYAGDVQSLEDDLAAETGDLGDLQKRRGELERLLVQASTNGRRIEDLYGNRFSTRRRRLTEITAQVKDMASAAGLDPRALTYPEEEIEDYGLVERSFVFSVEGTYLELRKFINLLELSDSFLTLEEMRLNEQTQTDGGLQIDVTLSTLFAKDDGTALPATSREGP